MFHGVFEEALWSETACDYVNKYDSRVVGTAAKIGKNREGGRRREEKLAHGGREFKMGPPRWGEGGCIHHVMRDMSHLNIWKPRMRLMASFQPVLPGSY